MIANNGPKVSNLTVGHHSFIPFTLHHEQGAPLLASLAPHTGDTLPRIIERPTFYRVGCRCGGIPWGKE